MFQTVENLSRVGVIFCIKDKPVNNLSCERRFLGHCEYDTMNTPHTHTSVYATCTSITLHSVPLAFVCINICISSSNYSQQRSFYEDPIVFR
jgi:hypothetical protein